MPGRWKVKSGQLTELTQLSEGAGREGSLSAYEEAEKEKQQPRLEPLQTVRAPREDAGEVDGEETVQIELAEDTERRSLLRTSVRRALDPAVLLPSSQIF